MIKTSRCCTKSFQDECWWDCDIITDPLVAGAAIPTFDCLGDCFPDTGTTCLSSLIKDVTTKGTCDTGYNPAAELSENGVNIWGWNELPNECDFEEDYDYY